MARRSAGFMSQNVIPLGLVARWALATDDGDIQGGDLPGWLPELFGGALHRLIWPTAAANASMPPARTGAAASSSRPSAARAPPTWWSPTMRWS